MWHLPLCDRFGALGFFDFGGGSRSRGFCQGEESWENRLMHAFGGGCSVCKKGSVLFWMGFPSVPKLRLAVSREDDPAQPSGLFSQWWRQRAKLECPSEDQLQRRKLELGCLWSARTHWTSPRTTLRWRPEQAGLVAAEIR